MQEMKIQDAAQILATARTEYTRIDALPQDCRPATIEEGYEIQDELTTRLPSDIYGWKIGATSLRARELVGVTSPICGRLLQANSYHSPAELHEHPFFMRAVESEFAFTLSSDLPKIEFPYNPRSVVRAISALHPAIEISDSRYHDWTQSGGASLVADNANDGAFVLGRAIPDWQEIDLTNHPVELKANGKLCANGGGNEVLDGPLGALAWLANARIKRGDYLKAGQVITTGSCTGVFIAEPGMLIIADFGELGSVDCQF